MTIGDRIPVTRRHPVDDTTNDTTTSGNGQAAADPTGTPGETITPRSEHPSARAATPDHPSAYEFLRDAAGRRH